MKPRILILALVAILLLFATGAMAAQVENQAAIEAFLRERMESLDIPGAALVIYALFINLPSINLNVPLLMRFKPDMGLILIVILLLTLGWGSLRSLWALRRWRASPAQQS